MFAAIYAAADGEMLEFVDLEEVALQISATAEQVEAATGALARLGLVDTPETGPTAVLTQEGILAFEDAARQSSDEAASARARVRMAERWALLGFLHRVSGGMPDVIVEDVTELGLDNDRLNTVASLLEYQGLLVRYGFVYALTAQGVTAWERSATEPRARL